MLIESINAPMSIQLSTVLSCRLCVSFPARRNSPLFPLLIDTRMNVHPSILNLRAIRDRQGKVNKYSNTLGRWVSDFLPETTDEQANPSIALSSRGQRADKTANVVPGREDTPTVSSGTYIFSPLSPGSRRLALFLSFLVHSPSVLSTATATTLSNTLSSAVGD